MGQRAPASLPDPGTRSGHANIRRDGFKLVFFAGPGEWTLRTLAPKSISVDNTVTAAKGVVAEVAVAV